MMKCKQRRARIIPHSQLPVYSAFLLAMSEFQERYAKYFTNHGYSPKQKRSSIKRYATILVQNNRLLGLYIFSLNSVTRVTVYMLHHLQLLFIRVNDITYNP